MGRAFSLALGILLFGCVPLLAQSERGTITGSVVDGTGAAVPGASITVTSQSTGVSRSTRSTEAGTYAAADISAGEYSVRAEKEGFKPVTRSGITLNAASIVRVDFSLEIGNSRQAIEVKGDVAQIKTDTEKLSVTVSRMMVEDLPLVVSGSLRSPLDLATLTPEAKSFSDDSFGIGGGQNKTYDITLDGVSMGVGLPAPSSWITYNTPPLDAITEFAVSTNGFKADYGHSLGGSMTFSSRSGTNAFHGSVFEFLRNTALDANYFFSNMHDIDRSVYKQNDFGVSVGGPVYIPKIFNGKNKTFFFTAYEGFRNRVGATASAATIPTPEMFAGDFSNWVNSAGEMIQIYDPATTTSDGAGNYTRTPYTNNQIPTDQFDPVAEKMLTAFAGGGEMPTPNTGAVKGTVGYVQNNYLITNGTSVTPWNKFSLKVDHIFSEKDQINVYFGRNTQATTAGPDGPPALPGYWAGYQTTRNTSYVGRLGWTHTFSPTVVNLFYTGINRMNQISSSAVEDMGNWKDKFCLGNVPDCNENLPTVGFGSDGYTGWGTNSKNGSRNPVFAVNDDLTWVHKRHTIKFGGMFQRNYYTGIGMQGIAGITNFSTTETGLPGVTSFSTGGGNSFASFLLGYVDNARIDTPRYVAFHYSYLAGYVMDDFRVNNRLTWSFGLRWETTPPPISRNDIFSDFSPTTENPDAGNILGALKFYGYGSGRANRRSLEAANYKAFGPRLGFAYTLDNNTVIRASFSRSFGQVISPGGSNHFQGAFTIFTASNTTSGIEPLFLLQDGMVAWSKPPSTNPGFANGSDVYWWQGRDATLLPTADQWTLSIQRQLSGSTMVEAAYSGMKGTHLAANLLSYNQLPLADLTQYGSSLLNSSITSSEAAAAGLTVPYSGFTGSVAQALRPYPQYQRINTGTGGGDHSGSSIYHAAILQVQRRFDSGLTLQSSYVFSKLLSNQDQPAGYGTIAMDHYNRKLEKSISQYDMTHNFKLAWIYAPPFGKGNKYFTRGVGSAVLGGWRLSAVQRYSSGQPVALATTVSLPLFAGTNRPTVTSMDGWGCSSIHGFDPSVNTFFVPAASFGTQPTNTFGNATRYNPKCRTFPNYNENIAAIRTFKIGEKLNFDLRLEAFNALNRVRFGTGSTTLQSSTFGRLSSNSDLLNTPRQVQVGLKMLW